MQNFCPFEHWGGKMWCMLLLFQAFLMAFPSAAAQPSISNRTIQLNSYLYPNSSKPWLSQPSGNFAFGFYPSSDNHSYIVGIWFANASEKPLVWAANGRQLVGPSSSLHLTKKGNVVIYDPLLPDKKIAVGRNSETARYASFGDNGNFAVYEFDSSLLWQTFDRPTDTLLPTQTLKPGEQLMTYSRRFVLYMDVIGDLLLYPTGRMNAAIPAVYWRSLTNVAESSLLLDQHGVLSIVGYDGSVVKNISTVQISIQDHYILAKLDTDGVLRVYTIARGERGGKSISHGKLQSWNITWSPISDGCDVKGICGMNAVCSPTADGDFGCHCPPGYKKAREDDKDSDCVVDKMDGEDYEEKMIPLHSTDWPFSSDFYSFNTIDVESCRNACLFNSFCVASIFSNANWCYLKGSPLLDGVFRKDGDFLAFIKVQVPIDNGNRPEKETPKKDERLLLIIGITFLSLCVVLLSLNFTFLFFRFKRKADRYMEKRFGSRIDISMPTFKYQELKAATGNFSETIGRGSSATVYRGRLCDGTPIAVKKIDKVVLQGEKEFEMEMKSIGKAHHRNLVEMLGYCNQGTHRLLVYEFMSNGSLSEVLLGDDRPCWEQRMQIACGIARGLAYLHEECRNQIIHCDIKPHNILLDNAFFPRISDFGMAKILGFDDSRTFTAARGTRGYMAPEWLASSPISAKVDVYSFGVMLLEIVFCKKGLGLEKPNGWSQKVSESFQEDEFGKLLEEDGVNGAPVEYKRVHEQMQRFVNVGLRCVRDNPMERPNMREVISMLESKVDYVD